MILEMLAQFAPVILIVVFLLGMVIGLPITWALGITTVVTVAIDPGITFAVVGQMHGVSEEEIDTMMSEYESRYVMKTEKIDHVRYQAREEIAIQRLLDRERCKAFTNTFQDLYGMEQLPGSVSYTHLTLPTT